MNGESKRNKEKLSFYSFSYFFIWHNTKILSQWPNLGFASVLTKPTNDNLFILMNDINLLIKEVCNQHRRKIDQLNLKLKVIVKIDANSDNNFLHLPVLTIITEKNLEKNDLENDSNNIKREMIFRKSELKNQKQVH